MYQQDQKLQ
jgi:hypothetical protein